MGGAAVDFAAFAVPFLSRVLVGIGHIRFLYVKLKKLIAMAAKAMMMPAIKTGGDGFQIDASPGMGALHRLQRHWSLWMR